MSEEIYSKRIFNPINCVQAPLAIKMKLPYYSRKMHNVYLSVKILIRNYNEATSN